MPTILTISLIPTPDQVSTTLNRGSGNFSSYRGYSFDGDVGTGADGYLVNSGGASGSLDDRFFYEGESCIAIATAGSGPPTFIVDFAGTLPQSFFSSIEVSIGTFNTADAVNYGTNNGRTSWKWSSASHLPTFGSETITITA